MTWCCYNGYCCPCYNYEIEKGLDRNWSEYKRMLHSVGWKQIPELYTDIDADLTNYWTMLSAVYKQTKNTPSRIRGLEYLHVALKAESVFCDRMRKFVDVNVRSAINDYTILN